jgi:hypothetical protein
MKVTKKAVLALFLGPSSIAVHDDGYMLWNAIWVNLVLK